MRAGTVVLVVDRGPYDSYVDGRFALTGLIRIYEAACIFGGPGVRRSTFPDAGMPSIARRPDWHYQHSVIDAVLIINRQGEWTMCF